MMTRPRMALASLLASAALLTAVPAASAQQQQDGLVNVAILNIQTGDITILEDVNVGVAASIAANVCGVKVGPLAVLGAAVDQSGLTQTACTTGTQTVTFLQN